MTRWFASPNVAGTSAVRRRRRVPRVLRTGVLALVTSLLLAAPAFGHYGPAPVHHESPPLQREVVQGLPVTGLDIFAAAAVAFALIAMGLTLRRLATTDGEGPHRRALSPVLAGRAGRRS